MTTTPASGRWECRFCMNDYATQGEAQEHERDAHADLLLRETDAAFARFVAAIERPFREAIEEYIEARVEFNLAASDGERASAAVRHSKAFSRLRGLAVDRAAVEKQ